MSVSSFPWLDKNFLQTSLQSQYGDVKVQDFEVKKSDTAKGDNYLSNMQRLAVRTEGGGAHHLIVKIRMKNCYTAAIMSDSSIFKKEKAMYGNILPRLDAMMQTIEPGVFERFSPRCFHASESYLMLEDLSPSGFRMLDRHQGLDLDHCLLIMRTLAKFHASSAVLHERDPEYFKVFSDSIFHEPAGLRWAKFFAGMARNLANELDTWPEKWRKYSAGFHKIADNIIPRLAETTRRTDSDFNVLLHGDVWVNNLLFKGQAESVRYVDYQLAQFASPAIDLNYFILTSPALDVRINHTDRLIEEYHRTLCDTLKALNYTRKLITLEELHEEMGRKSMYGFWALIGPFAVVQCRPDCGFDMNVSLETGKNPGPSMYTENYRSGLKWHLPIFERYGFFD